MQLKSSGIGSSTTHTQQKKGRRSDLKNVSPVACWPGLANVPIRLRKALNLAIEPSTALSD